MQASGGGRRRTETARPAQQPAPITIFGSPQDMPPHYESRSCERSSLPAAYAAWRSRHELRISQNKLPTGLPRRRRHRPLHRLPRGESLQAQRSFHVGQHDGEPGPKVKREQDPCCRLRSRVRTLNSTTDVSSSVPNRGDQLARCAPGTMSGSSTIFPMVRKYAIRTDAMPPKIATARPFHARLAKGANAGSIDPLSC